MLWQTDVPLCCQAGSFWRNRPCQKTCSIRSSGLSLVFQKIVLAWFLMSPIDSGTRTMVIRTTRTLLLSIATVVVCSWFSSTSQSGRRSPFLPSRVRSSSLNSWWPVSGSMDRPMTSWASLSSRRSRSQESSSSPRSRFANLASLSNRPRTNSGHASRNWGVNSVLLKLAPRFGRIMTNRRSVMLAGLL